MQIFENNYVSSLSKKTYIALGSFDGLHLGHIRLIKECINLAKKNNGLSMVYTFKNHPLTTINPEKAPKLLMDNNNKASVLSGIGVDILALVDFNKKLMETSAEDFIKMLVKDFNLGGVVVGFNYRFGHKNQGDVNLLKELSIKYNFIVKIMDPLQSKEELISSSRIRKLIQEGNITEANKLLYKPFMLSGKVIAGKQLGRTLGYPTANIYVDKKYMIPKAGVYYTLVGYKDKLYKGMTNVGYNPTVALTEEINIETYILDFDKEIYDDYINVYFMDRIRDEVKFDSLESLIDQMDKDYSYVKSKKIEEI
ncbi:MAG: bifunctional riboflavin kinase/FAD synthetase [Clostridiales bacterium]|uniref:bifunctional riboflavin kinase/FAD synthetase n=1 Tax=Clostridium sp. N3C TaxID=1776758 RepID=UPI00092E0C7F|nr:bifunctional riboflavin kinase/FAD synthetase [Clostridium sp. N3C]NLZ48207.1 bifunctional riboflavin kinase/FAD synthetase [Clostridiales bacterium]SCN21905.1 Riboflavin biosynthesis protein RibF [Clostridium sp. N3C]